MHKALYGTCATSIYVLQCWVFHCTSFMFFLFSLPHLVMIYQEHVSYVFLPYNLKCKTCDAGMLFNQDRMYGDWEMSYILYSYLQITVILILNVSMSFWFHIEANKSCYLGKLICHNIMLPFVSVCYFPTALLITLTALRT